MLLAVADCLVALVIGRLGAQLQLLGWLCILLLSSRRFCLPYHPLVLLGNVTIASEHQ